MLNRTTSCMAVFVLLTPAFLSAQTFDREQMLDLVTSQRYKEAATYIRSFYPGEIPDSKIQTRLAFCYYLSGNLLLAEKEYTTALAKDSTNRTVLGYLASINEQRRNFSKAKGIYEKVLRLDSSNAATCKKLADIADKQQDSSSYTYYLSKANALDPENSEYAYEYAKFLIKKKKHNLADTVISAAQKADPEDIGLVELRAEIAQVQKKWKELVSYAAQALKMGSNSAQVVNLLGIGQYYTKQYKECIQTYSIFEGTANANEATYYYTALAWRQLGDMKKSTDNLVMCLKSAISKNVPIYYQEMSANSQFLKKYTLSLSQLDKAEQYETKNVFNYTRARIFDENMNDPKSALKFFKRYLKNYDEAVDDKECYTYSKARAEQLEPKTASTN